MYGSDIKRDTWEDEYGNEMHHEDGYGTTSNFSNFQGYKTEDGYDDEHDDDYQNDEEFEDPYANMTIDELKERLPLYMFKTPDEKIVYFKELNQNYFQEIKNVKGSKMPPKKPKNVNFITKRKIRSKKNCFLRFSF